MKVTIDLGKEERKQILGNDTFQNYLKVIGKIIFRIQKACKPKEKEFVGPINIPEKVEPATEPKQEVIPNGTTEPVNPN